MKTWLDLSHETKTETVTEINLIDRRIWGRCLKQLDYKSLNITTDQTIGKVKGFDKQKIIDAVIRLSSEYL